MGEVVSQKADARGGTVSDPYVQVAIMVPVDPCQCAAIVQKVESGYRRDIGEAWPTRIQKGAVPFMSAPRRAALREIAQLLVRGQERGACFVIGVRSGW